ncbi:MAG: hypothetical protein M3T56_19145 [Chloroflexota bacterium]|nr:hypothetical protein [Chloroflexota bacterium]
MRFFAAVFAALVVASCSSTPQPVTAPPMTDLVIPTTVPNGKVEVVVKPTYPVGQPVRATIRLIPRTGTLRGPLDPFIQASGFHGTATVRHLAVDSVSVTAGSIEVPIVWDMRDDSGQVVGGDDYSLVFSVIDDAGRTTPVGATLQVR